jgi:hypothetical protein
VLLRGFGRFSGSNRRRLNSRHGSIPYTAPASGYNSDVAFAVSAGDEPWVRVFDDYYYFTARNGSMFGRIRIGIPSDATRNYSFFQAEGFENPKGSRNLEYDGN